MTKLVQMFVKIVREQGQDIKCSRSYINLQILYNGDFKTRLSITRPTLGSQISISVHFQFSVQFGSLYNTVSFFNILIIHGSQSHFTMLY